VSLCLRKTPQTNNVTCSRREERTPDRNHVRTRGSQLRRFSRPALGGSRAPWRRRVKEASGNELLPESPWRRRTSRLSPSRFPDAGTLPARCGTSSESRRAACRAGTECTGSHPWDVVSAREEARVRREGTTSSTCDSYSLTQYDRLSRSVQSPRTAIGSTSVRMKYVALDRCSSACSVVSGSLVFISQSSLRILQRRYCTSDGLAHRSVPFRNA